MKFFAILSVLALLCAVPVSAQFTLTQTSFPTTGSHNMGEATSATFNVGSSGANQTWTFSEYTWEYVLHYELVDVTTSPYYADFPASNRCVHATGDVEPMGGVHIYYRMASDGLYFLGVGSADTVATPVSEARVIPFPSTYQTNWTTVIRYDYEPIPGYHFTNTDSSLNTVDGWGTLNTPYHNESTLRLFSHTWVITQVPVLPPVTTQYVSYSWFSSQGEELLVVTSEQDVTDPNFTTGYLEMTGVPQAVEPHRGPVAQKFSVGQNYPNPFNPTTSLPIETVGQSRVTVKIYDETGRLVSSCEYELSAGRHDLPLNGSNWAAGTYFAHVLSAAQAQTVKMQLIK